MNQLMTMPAFADLPLWVVPAALVHLVGFVVLLLPTWRAFAKAGVPGVAALMLIVPVLGWIGVAVLLATGILRKAGWPAVLAVLALVPLVNIVFMYLLAWAAWGDVPQLPVARAGPPRMRPGRQASRQPPEIVVDTIVAQQVDSPSGRPAPTRDIAAPSPATPPAQSAPAVPVPTPGPPAPDAPTQMPRRARDAAESADRIAAPASLDVVAAPVVAAPDDTFPRTAPASEVRPSVASNDTKPPDTKPPGTKPQVAAPESTASLVFTSPPVSDAPPAIPGAEVNTDPPQVPPRAANDPAPRPQRPRPTQEPGPMPPNPRGADRAPEAAKPVPSPTAKSVAPVDPVAPVAPKPQVEQVVPMQRTPGPSIAAKARMEQPPTVINIGRGRTPEPTEREWKFSGSTEAQGNFQILLQEKSVREAPDGIVLGRSGDRAAMVVRDDSVSRAHIRFIWRRGAVHVEDLESLNGTYVDGQRLLPGTSAELLDETELEVGKIKLLVRRA
ncbi:MAG: FHA domain-containing protein [Alphaproteobacteria bacterium]